MYIKVANWVFCKRLNTIHYVFPDGSASVLVDHNSQECSPEDHNDVYIKQDEPTTN